MKLFPVCREFASPPLCLTNGVLSRQVWALGVRRNHIGVRRSFCACAMAWREASQHSRRYGPMEAIKRRQKCIVAALVAFCASANSGYSDNAQSMRRVPALCFLLLLGVIGDSELLGWLHWNSSVGFVV